MSLSGFPFRMSCLSWWRTLAPGHLLLSLLPTSGRERHHSLDVIALTFITLWFFFIDCILYSQSNPATPRQLFKVFILFTSSQPLVREIYLSCPYCLSLSLQDPVDLSVSSFNFFSQSVFLIGSNTLTFGVFCTPRERYHFKYCEGIWRRCRIVGSVL